MDPVFYYSRQSQGGAALIPVHLPYTEKQLVEASQDEMKQILDKHGKEDANLLRDGRRKLKNRVRDNNSNAWHLLDDRRRGRRCCRRRPRDPGTRS